MYKKHLVVISVLIIFISLFSFSVKSYDVSDYDISDPYFTNQLIDKIDTPRIELDNDAELTLTFKNPYPEEMENLTFKVSIYWYSYLDVDKNISEVDEPPVFDNGETYSILDIDDLSTNDSKDLKYIIHTFEDTEEGVYSLRFKLEFSMNNETEVMKSRGHFSSEEWDEAKSPGERINLTKLNVSGILPESTFEVKNPIPRWPHYLLGIITTVSGVLAVMFYMQEKYSSFPKLEKTFDNWTGKLDKLWSGLNKRFKKR